MSTTLDELSTYSKLFQLPSRTISSILYREDIIAYCLLRDKLTYAELLELQITLKDIYYHQASHNKIDFSKYIKLTENEIKKLSTIFDLKSGTLLEISTFIQLTPKELAFNIVSQL